MTIRHFKNIFRSSLIFVALLSWVFVLGSCTYVPKSAYKETLEQPEDARPAPIRFSRLKNRLPIGSDIGVLRPGCDIVKTPLDRNTFSRIKRQDMEDSLAEMLEMQGYDIIDTLDTVLDEEEKDEFMRGEYSLGAKLIGADADLCMDAGLTPVHKIFYYILFPKTQGISGRLYLEIEWALYDTLRRTVVYKTTTKGYAKRFSGGEEGIANIFNEAFSMAAHNLGTDKAFHDLVFYGKKPDNSWRKGKKHPNDERPRKFDAQEDVLIKNPSLWTESLQKCVEKITDNAVVVQAGRGHGSGFFITKEGHILTNSHVVGDAMRVRVVTSHRKEKLVAEVLRSHKGRDVALLKLEEIPEGLEINPAPIKAVWPKVSSDIYAVGAPVHTRLQDTVTRGIVSAHRKIKTDNLIMKYIQGDVQIIGGNSGGPLVDAYGNVVGITSSALYKYKTENNSGLNLFIPISEALHFLDIDLVEP